MPTPLPVIPASAVTRLWLHLQGFSTPRSSEVLTPETLTRLLEQCGGLQLDSVNALERAHYLTLWSRFGAYDKAELDRWVHEKRIAYEYWGHEASLLPISHLPLGLRRMRRFPPPAWQKAAWWKRWNTSPASKRRVLRLLREQGPLEKVQVQGTSPAHTKEDKQSLLVLWHSGRTAVVRRRHFRRVYDLAERVYPAVTPASGVVLDDSWLLIGLRGNGIASEQHLVNYWTGPKPDAATRHRIITRNLRAGRIRAVRVSGFSQTYYALPAHLDLLHAAPEPHGTTLICPFDSLLWQRQRAEDLLQFTYRLEIYVPPAKRVFGYYVCPVLHHGRLVGRTDLKLHRKKQTLEVKRLFWESGFEAGPSFRVAFRDTLESLASFLGAADIQESPHTA